MGAQAGRLTAQNGGFRPRRAVELAPIEAGRGGTACLSGTHTLGCRTPDFEAAGPHARYPPWPDEFGVGLTPLTQRRPNYFLPFLASRVSAIPPPPFPVPKACLFRSMW
jgi:hypothetical protein